MNLDLESRQIGETLRFDELGDMDRDRLLTELRGDFEFAQSDASGAADKLIKANGIVRQNQCGRCVDFTVEHDGWVWVHGIGAGRR